ncbi:unnamed protein product [Notodromas monacha]|uniref:GPAT/DHAPAT C-terminal domain-containing protein n=1 Tax=Notodromas monacha TaxID=399045 RepID=A0A7R9GFQ6_9CRUS|nr:unnamed protein product [Notodromas monacha]CAG0920927.1 unnamed protein product [Notodromas monacha]
MSGDTCQFPSEMLDVFRTALSRFVVLVFASVGNGIFIYGEKRKFLRSPSGMALDKITMISSLRNALSVPEQRGGWFYRQTAYLQFIWNLNYRNKYTFKMNTLDVEVPQDERVWSAIRTTVDEQSQQGNSGDSKVELFKSLKEKMEALWDKMKARMNFTVLNCIGWVTFHVLNLFWRSVQFNETQIQTLKAQIEECPHPVVYLPLHKSHFDYIIYTWMLYRTGLKMPIQAAGENLNIFLFGFIINRMGGLLSAVVKAFRNKHIEDALLVPVGLSYERIVEAGYPNEILGKPKVPESFFYTLFSTLKLFLQWKKCNMRLDFGQPVSLRKFFNQHKDVFGPLTDEERSAAESSQVEFLRNGLNVRRMPRTYTGPLFGMDYVDEQERLFVSALAKHMVHDAGRYCSVMSTHVLAAVLLYGIPSNGATYSNALKNFEWICAQCQKRGRDLGFYCQAEDAFQYSLDLFGNEIAPVRNTFVEDSSVNGRSSETLWISSPHGNMEALIELSFLANNLMSSFNFEGILAVSIQTLVGKLTHGKLSGHGNKSFFYDENYRTKFLTNTGLSLKRPDLEDRCLGLVELLGFETVLYPPCASASQGVREAIQSFEEDILHIPNNNQGNEEEPFDNDDGAMKLILTESSLRKLEFFQRILAPTIATYAYSVQFARNLGDERISEQDFVRKCLDVMSSRIAAGREKIRLCLNSDTLKNSLKLWVKWHLLDTAADEASGARVFFLHPRVADDDEMLDKMEERVLMYRV